MKKLLIITMTMACVLGMSSCGSKSSNNETSSNEASSSVPGLFKLNKSGKAQFVLKSSDYTGKEKRVGYLILYQDKSATYESYGWGDKCDKIGWEYAEYEQTMAEGGKTLRYVFVKREDGFGMIHALPEIVINEDGKIYNGSETESISICERIKKGLDVGKAVRKDHNLYCND